MGPAIFVIVGFVLFLAAFRWLPAAFEAAASQAEPASSPSSRVLWASRNEVVFGLILVFLGIAAMPDSADIKTAGSAVVSACAMFLPFVLGIAWTGLARLMNQGNYRACQICLWLSVGRLLTIVGAPFSVLSILLLMTGKDPVRFTPTGWRNKAGGSTPGNPDQPPDQP
jgi:hypothetical protein